jgi:hypothetical protein
MLGYLDQRAIDRDKRKGPVADAADLNPNGTYLKAPT